MDRRQKDLLSSAQLAHEIDFDEIVRYLNLVKLVSKEKAEAIKVIFSLTLKSWNLS